MMERTEHQSVRDDAAIYLTIDVESDYGRSGTYEILEKAGPFFSWLRTEQIPLTAFVTGTLLEKGHKIIDQLLEAEVPVAVHGYMHAPETFRTMYDSHAEEITRGAEAFRKRTGRPPTGYRAAAGIISREDVLLMNSLGFRYDASVFPIKRPGRYNFSGLPKTPFRWEGTSLVEVPFGLLTRSLPDGMTFINLFGAFISGKLISSEICSLTRAPKWHVTDLHMHNLFSKTSALGSLPMILRLVYLAGSIKGGFSTLQRLVSQLRKAGYKLGNLEKDALAVDVSSLPVVNLACFDPVYGARS